MGKDEALVLVLKQFKETGDINQIKEDLNDIYSKDCNNKTWINEKVGKIVQTLIDDFRNPMFPDMEYEVEQRLHLTIDGIPKVLVIKLEDDDNEA